MSRDGGTVRFTKTRIGALSETDPSQPLNHNLILNVAAGDPLPARRMRENVDDRPVLPCSCTVFWAVNGERYPRFDWSNPAEQDRLYELAYPALPDEVKDPNFNRKAAGSLSLRRSLLTLLVRRAVKNRNAPPPLIPKVSDARNQRQTASRGDAGVWLASALTPAEGLRLSSKRLWDAAQQASATQGTDRAFGVKRTRLTQIANDMFPMPPLKNQRDTVTGKPAMCWEGWDVSTAIDTDVCQHGRPLAPPCPDCEHAAAASAAAHRPEQGGMVLSGPTCFEGCGADVEAPGKTCPACLADILLYPQRYQQCKVCLRCKGHAANCEAAPAALDPAEGSA